MARIEKPSLYDQRFSRRKFLIGAAIATVYGGAMIYDKSVPRFLPSAPEAQNLEPILVETGVVAIYKGVNIRTSPIIPNRTRFREPDNRIAWEDIEEVNNIPLNNTTVFLIANPLVVEGQEVDLSGLWFKVMIKAKNDSQAKPYYMSDSSQTTKFVVSMVYTGHSPRYGNKYGISEGRFLEEDDVGRVIVPDDPNTMAQDIMPGLLAEWVGQRLNGQALQEDRLLKDVNVVACCSEDEKEEMERQGITVNVRNYPDLRYRNGEPVYVVGKAPQGNRIAKVLIPNEDAFYPFAVFRSEDVIDPLLDQNGNPFKPAPGDILTIHRWYLSASFL